MVLISRSSTNLDLLRDTTKWDKLISLIYCQTDSDSDSDSDSDLPQESW